MATTENPATSVASTRSKPFTGQEYLESLKDGREIWIYGERVKDVTTHPAFRNGARSMAAIYDLKRADPELFRLSYDYVGDLSETVALMWPADPAQKQAIIDEIDATLTDVYRATRAWRSMLERLRRVVEEWKLFREQPAGRAR